MRSRSFLSYFSSYMRRAGGSSKPITPEKLPTFTFATMDDVYAAIAAGNIAAVSYWLANRATKSRAWDEAALDLAVQKNQLEIAKLFREQLRAKAVMDLERRKNAEATSDLAKRVTIKFNKLNFNSLTLETYFSGKIEFYIKYRTPLIEPYFEPLKQWGGRDYPEGMIVTFEIKRETDEEIYWRLFQILRFLVPTQTACFNEMFTVLEEAFLCVKNNFRHKNYFMQHQQLELTYRVPNTYRDYQLFSAITNLRYGDLLDLLRSGASANSQFNGDSLLLVAALFGINNVFLGPAEKHKDNYQALLDIIDLLLQYNADPSAITQSGESIAEYLSRYELLEKKEHKKKLYRDFIQRLAAAKSMIDSVPIHPTMDSLPVAQTLIKMNEVLERRKKHSPYIDNIVTFSTIKSTCAWVTTLKGERLLIEGKNRHDLTATELNQMYLLYKRIGLKLHGEVGGEELSDEELLSRQEQETYWQKIISPDNGLLYFDMIKHNNVVMGFVITEVIETELNSIPTLIYYSRASMGELPSYPGLMQLIAGMRNLAASESDKESLLYYEAVSPAGFAAGHAVMDFPIKNELEEKMAIIIHKIHSSDEILRKNGVWYVKDDLYAPNIKPEKERYSHPTVFFKHVYEKAYQVPGYAVGCLYENNNEKRTAYIENLSPLIGEDNIIKMFDLHADKSIKFKAKL